MLRYLDKDNLLPTFQSGFRKGHSTETLLVRLLSDIYGAIDRSQVILALFAVSTTFDTVDHDIILRRLSTSFGLSGNFLDWIFPTSLTVPSLRSTCLLGLHVFLSRLACPGICAGPSSLIILFILLILVLSWPLAEPCSVLNQSYAGDLQAFLHCPASAAITEARAMNRAMEVLEAWMSSNRLRPNSSKTQFIWLGTRQQLAKIDLEALAQEFPQITFSQWQRN